ncbi:MAG TPA: membrane protein insertase YidC [Verrucomicrobiae bacterium]|jgi:YidC/Oxa1 family membrane protein insertase
MDKTGIAAISLCVVLLGVWFFHENKVEQQRLQQQMAYNAAHRAELAAAATNAIITNVASTPPATTTAGVPAFDSNLPEELIVLTNANARYTFTSRGGGLKLVELLKYPETISARWRKGNESASNGVATLNLHATVPVLAVLGNPSLMGDGNFTLTATGDGVHAEKLLTNGLLITKEFHLSSNYLVNASVSLKNESGQSFALPAQQYVVGTSTPMDVDDMAAMYIGAMWSDGKTYTDTPITYFNTNTSYLGVIPRTPTPDFHAGDGNVVWAAAHNQFFALLAMTPTNQPAQQVVAHPIELPQFAGAEQSPFSPRGIETALVYPAQTLTVNSSVTRSITLFAGPKEFRTLSLIGEQFQNRADLAMNFGTGYMSFWGVGTFFAKLLLSGMNWLHDITSMSYGWAIVTITLLMRAAFWPLTAASMRSAKKMQALAPEVKALKEKYKDDQQKFTQKQMELWKKNKVNPMSGCLPMLIQMPVFFGFLAMIRCAIELRGAHWLWVADLTKPDTIFMIPSLNFPFNLLPLLMVGAMVWQAHLQPASPGMDPSQQKMMRYMPLIFLLFLYNYSSGMALYMTVSTLAGVLQTKLTKLKTNPVATPALTPAPKSKK